MAKVTPLKPGESTITQRLSRRCFPTLAHYLGAVLTWNVYGGQEQLEAEVARIEAMFPFAPEYADFALSPQVAKPTNDTPA